MCFWWPSPFPLSNSMPFERSTIFSARNFDAGNPGMRNWLSTVGVFARLSVWFTMTENVPLPRYGVLKRGDTECVQVGVTFDITYRPDRMSFHVYLMITWNEKVGKKENQIYQISTWCTEDFPSEFHGGESRLAAIRDFPVSERITRSQRTPTMSGEGWGFQWGHNSRYTHER